MWCRAVWDGLALGTRLPPFAWEGFGGAGAGGVRGAGGEPGQSLCSGRLVLRKVGSGAELAEPSQGRGSPGHPTPLRCSLAMVLSRPADYRAGFGGSSRQINLFLTPSPGIAGLLGLGFIKAWRAWCSSPGQQGCGQGCGQDPSPALTGWHGRPGGTEGLPPRLLALPGRTPAHCKNFPVGFGENPAGQCGGMLPPLLLPTFPAKNKEHGKKKKAKQPSLREKPVLTGRKMGTNSRKRSYF